MRASHCSKTYQLAAAEVVNSACFRPFLRKNPGISAIRGIISPSADAPSAGAASAPALLRRRQLGPLRVHQEVRAGRMVRRQQAVSGAWGCGRGSGWQVHRLVWGLNAGEPQPCGWGSRPFNDVPAVTYSPTPSRVQYHRRCGS